MRGSRLFIAVGFAGLYAAAQPAAGVSQRASTQRPDDQQWTVSSDAFADVWYHTLALVGYEGYGPFPLYDHGYAAGRAGSSNPRLTLLRTRLERDSAFEVVHFLPLYLRGKSPAAAFASLRAAAQPGALHDLVAIAEDEWNRTVRERRAAEGAARAAAESCRTEIWRNNFAPALAGYFATAGIRGGSILVSPAVGPEGRLLQAPNGQAVVVVGGNATDTTDGPLLAAVRELAFTVVHRSAEGHAAPADRARAEYASDLSATRAGAMLLDAVSPALARRYRALYGAAAPGRFDARYPLDPATEARLRREVLAMVRAAPPASR